MDGFFPTTPTLYKQLLFPCNLHERIIPGPVCNPAWQRGTGVRQVSTDGAQSLTKSYQEQLLCLTLSPTRTSITEAFFFIARMLSGRSADTEAWISAQQDLPPIICICWLLWLPFPRHRGGITSSCSRLPMPFVGRPGGVLGKKRKLADQWSPANQNHALRWDIEEDQRQAIPQVTLFFLSLGMHFPPLPTCA